jgi:hypothetical protein
MEAHSGAGKWVKVGERERGGCSLNARESGCLGAVGWCGGVEKNGVEGEFSPGLPQSTHTGFASKMLATAFTGNFTRKELSPDFSPDASAELTKKKQLKSKSTNIRMMRLNEQTTSVFGVFENN